MSVDFSCGISKQDINLTDAQCDELHNDEQVVKARRALLRAMTDVLKDPSLAEEVKRLDAAYHEIFYKKLKEVIENPPEPRKETTVKWQPGFAKRP